MRAVITGGAGFIGANLVRRAAKAGWEMTVVDDLSRGRRAYLDGVPGVTLVQGSILDQRVMRQALRGAGAVVHLAAFGGVRESLADPVGGLQVNGVGAVALMALCAELGVPRFVLASTGGAIVGDQEVPVHEGIVPHPISPYGASKLTAEAYAHVFAKSFGLSTLSLRFSNVYGPFSGHKANAVPKFILALLKGAPITIYGDGENTRDYIYVDDIADAIVGACSRDFRDFNGEALHLGTGVETSVNSLVETLVRVAKVPAKVQHTEAVAGEVRRNCVDASLAGRLLGFRARVGLEEGLARTWEWFSRQGW